MESDLGFGQKMIADLSPARVWAVTVAGIAIIGVVDWASGVELRVFPLYFAPISFAAWHRGWSGAVVVAALATASWFASNFLAGRTFSTMSVWMMNTLVQGVSFAFVGLLIATLRTALIRERDIGRIDPVTAVANSRAFYEQGATLLALCRRKRHPVTVAYVDLDHFKAVNDRLGHAAGDELLRRVATLLQRSVRPSDLFARLGGDEFALLLPESNPEEAAAVLERLRRIVTEALASGEPPVTASVGAVTFTTAPETVEEMVREADSRMYAAKRRGRNRVQLEVVSPKAASAPAS